MVPVTKTEFFAAIGPMNVHPRAERERSVWEHVQTRAVVGISVPGYTNTWTDQGKTPDGYWLTAAIANTTGSGNA